MIFIKISKFGGRFDIEIAEFPVRRPAASIDEATSANFFAGRADAEKNAIARDADVAEMLSSPPETISKPLPRRRENHTGERISVALTRSRSDAERDGGHVKFLKSVGMARCAVGHYVGVFVAPGNFGEAANLHN